MSNNTPSSAESNVLATLSPDPGILRLTKTMLNKSIIDANLTIRAFAVQFGVDMESMEAGDRVKIPATYADGTACTLSFYLTANRGDKRFSCSGLKARADVGDLVALTTRTGPDGSVALVVNVSAAAGDLVSRALQATA
jgi:phage/plasmid primase-like uncharacterized protein